MKINWKDMVVQFMLIKLKNIMNIILVNFKKVKLMVMVKLQNKMAHIILEVFSKESLLEKEKYLLPTLVYIQDK